MSDRVCISLTHAADDPDRTTVAFVLANAALGSEKETVVFLSTEGVRVSQEGYADDINEEGFAPLSQLMGNFVEGGGRILVCAPCFNKRGLDPARLIDGAAVVGGATLIEFISEGVPVISY